jgi:hypothetical protein
LQQIKFDSTTLMFEIINADRTWRLLAETAEQVVLWGGLLSDVSGALNTA